jgi:hypothetical protein
MLGDLSPLEQRKQREHYRNSLNSDVPEADEDLTAEAEEEVLGSCGCTDYHMADCSLGGAWYATPYYDEPYYDEEAGRYGW